MAIRGGWLFILFLTALTLHDLSRPFLQPAGGAVFFTSSGMPVELRDNLHRLDGIHQINDADEIECVIKMAGLTILPRLLVEDRDLWRPIPGKLYEFNVVGSEIVSVDTRWMPAARRMALGIPLQINRMNSADWCDLPGVGSELARRIIEYRQKSGENLKFSDLLKVQGIGEKRLAAWKPYFLIR